MSLKICVGANVGPWGLFGPTHESGSLFVKEESG